MGYRYSGRRSYRRSNAYRRRDTSLRDGIGDLAFSGVKTVAKACIKTERAARTVGRIAFGAAALPFRIGKGIYRTFRK